MADLYLLHRAHSALTFGSVEFYVHVKNMLNLHKSVPVFTIVQCVKIELQITQQP